MKKSVVFSILFFSFGLIFSLTSCGTTQKPIKTDILMPHPLGGIPGTTGRIAIKDFSSTEIEFQVRIPISDWFYCIIEDDEGDIIAGAWYYIIVEMSTIKMKAEEGFEFAVNKKYILSIGKLYAVPHPIFGYFQPYYSYEFALSK